MPRTQVSAVQEVCFWNTVGMTISLFMFYVSPVFGILITLYFLFSPLSLIILIYLLWIYLDRKTPHQGGRRINWIRSLKIFQQFRNYFPQVLVKTADLPTTNNYIFCIFPHGILCTGAHAQFASENPEFNELFPGINVTCHTLNCNFYFPFSREYVLALGFCSVSKESLTYELTQAGTGRASVLVVGGSAEAMISSPGTHRVVLKNRKGFAKLSLTTGAYLVPIYIFGETDLYNQWTFKEDSIIHKLQNSVRKVTGVAPICALGRGFVENTFGLLPFAKPVYTVIGNPIPVVKKANPTREEIEGLHATFICELKQLFHKYKFKYLKNPESIFLSVED